MADVKVTDLTSASGVNIATKFIITDSTTTRQVSASSIDNIMHDVVYLQVYDASTAIVASTTGAMYFIVPDILDDGEVVKFTAGITGTVPTGNTSIVLKSNAGATMATATVTTGNRVGTTTSISNGTLSSGDRLAIDISSTVGGTPTGLDVMIKVQKGW